MRRFSRGLAVLFAAVGVSSAQASDDVFGYAVPSEEALRCLSEDLPVAVKVDYSVMAHPLVTRGTFYLKVGLSGAVVSGRGNDWDDPVKLSPRKLSRAEGERVLLDLTSAMLRGETTLSCGDSSSNSVAIVEWACGAVETKRGTVALMAPMCSLLEGHGTDAMGTYARAIGIRDVVVKALRQAHR